MKIALLTIWHEKNYGAELQAYATIKAIKHLGHCPEMINIHLASKEQPSFLGRIANFRENLWNSLEKKGEMTLNNSTTVLLQCQMMPNRKC